MGSSSLLTSGSVHGDNTENKSSNGELGVEIGGVRVSYDLLHGCLLVQRHAARDEHDPYHLDGRGYLVKDDSTD